MGQTFNEGYHQAILDIEEHIDASIRNNGGAVTAHQVIAVFNDILAHVHHARIATAQDTQSESFYIIVGQEL